MIHELSYGIQRLADGRRKERFRSYLQNLLSSGLPLLMDRSPRLLQPRGWVAAAQLVLFAMPPLITPADRSAICRVFKSFWLLPSGQCGIGQFQVL